MPPDGNREATFSELSTGYNPAQAALHHAHLSEEKKALYHIEKGIGKRLPNGVQPLKKLSARHQRILALHLTGKYSGVQIATAINCSAFTVHRTLNDPLSQKVINDFHSSVEMDLRAMLPLAIEAVRDGLEDGDIDVRMRAVDRFERMTGRSEEKEKGRAFNLSISFTQNVRERFFDELRSAALIDVDDVTEVEEESRGHAAGCSFPDDNDPAGRPPLPSSTSPHDDNSSTEEPADA